MSGSHKSPVNGDKYVMLLPDGKIYKWLYKGVTMISDFTSIDLFNIKSDEIRIQPDEPEDDNWQIWIDNDSAPVIGTEVVDSVNGTQTDKAPSVRAVVQDLVSILYPVGSIYMSTNDTNPKDLFGIGT